MGHNSKPLLVSCLTFSPGIHVSIPQWAVEDRCVGFTMFCACFLSSSDPELRDIPAHMLKQSLEVLQSRCTPMTRRAAGLPMLILCVVSAEEASKALSLLAHSIHTLLDTARAPLPQDWDQTLVLPQGNRKREREPRMNSPGDGFQQRRQ
uniref:DUF2428 domain-containing protein n=1 Tax=Hucho hucho TaxID=62062 RepID=A0A4W5N6L5_9TELE